MTSWKHKINTSEQIDYLLMNNNSLLEAYVTSGKFGKIRTGELERLIFKISQITISTQAFDFYRTINN